MGHTYTLQYFAILREQARCREEKVTTAATPPGELYPVVEVDGATTASTYHWPNGWRCVSFIADPIPGTTISENVEVWEYQQRVTF